jgi:nondiscriminating glutamyl-tRNA synthetase
MTASSPTSTVRVRYAPSPTGYLHVGGVRTLLFNWLYARKHKGTLVLRIEDTDQERSTREHEKMLLEDVILLGLEGDESPQKGGPHPPYRQSERIPIYSKYVKKLLDEGKAYSCFCSPELIGQKREAALKMGRTPVYDGTCARLGAEEVKAKIAAGERPAVRFRAPDKDYILEDEVRGRVEFKSGTVGDFLITRAVNAKNPAEVEAGFGMPVYNFCCVVDDALMEMTHIIRGEDHLSNTARQLILYDQLGWKRPVFAHTAMVLGSDRLKLSKRNGDTSARDYLNKGYLKEALLNFLALQGWGIKEGAITPKSGHPEILTLEELQGIFELSGFQKAPAVFDVQKLQWMNSFYMRMLPVETILERAAPFLALPDNAAIQSKFSALSQDKKLEWVDLVRGEATLLEDLPRLLGALMGGDLVLEEDAKPWIQSGATVIESFRSLLKADSAPFDADAIDRLQKEAGTQSAAKGKNLFMPIRASILGKTKGPEMKKVLPLLGKAEVLNRIEYFQNHAK